MRALLLAENWPPRVGGIEHYLTSIAGFLPNGSVTVVAPLGSNNYGFGAGVYKVIPKRFFWPFVWPAWLPLFFFVKKLVAAEKIEIILCGKALFEGLLAYHVKKALGIPYIVFTYAMEIEVWAAQNRAKLVKVLGAADRVVYINEETKKTLLSLGVTEQQLVKIWPGVNEVWLQEIPAEKVMAIGQKYNLQQPYILTGARLIERKGIDTVIEAFGKLDTEKFGNYTLAIFGTGPDEARLKKLAAKQGKKMVFLGHVPDRDLPALYKGAELFVLTPREVNEDREGFGIVYLEAAAQGRAVLGSLSGGVPEAVIHNQTGVLVQPTAAAVKDALQRLLTDGPFRERLGQAGKKRIDDEFRWQKRIVLVKGMIDAVLHERALKKGL